jgi:hypothetical protein
MAQVLLIGLGTWFVAALIVGVALGKMIAAADRAAGIESSERAGDAHRAA